MTSFIKKRSYLEITMYDVCTVNRAQCAQCLVNEILGSELVIDFETSEDVDVPDSDRH